MPIMIEILDGPDAGSRVALREGMTLGRAAADVIIRDPKVSSTHAEVASNDKGQLVLLDMNSSNGLHISGRRVKKVTLLPGVIFEIGRTQLQVLANYEEVTVEPAMLKTWNLRVKEALEEKPIENEPPSIQPESFSPPLILKFTQGIQADQEIILGYGPRKAGADSLDIELLDQDAPREAFELLPGPGMVEIKILATGKVKLNNSSVQSEMLKEGDLISVGSTLIKVSYL